MSRDIVPTCLEPFGYGHGAIKDACSGRIVGYSMDVRLKASLAVAALRDASARRGVRGTVVHSDRGSQTGLNR